MTHRPDHLIDVSGYEDNDPQDATRYAPETGPMFDHIALIFGALAGSGLTLLGLYIAGAF